MSSAFEANAQAAEKLTSLLQPLANQAAETAGSKAAAAGNYDTHLAFTAQDELFNRAVQTGYLAKASNDIDAHATTLALDHQADGDVEQLGSAFDDAKQAYLATTPGWAALAVGSQWDKTKTEHVSQLAVAQRERGVQTGKEALQYRIQGIDDQLSQATDVNDPKVQDLLAQRDMLNRSLVSNPLYGISQEQVDLGTAQLKDSMLAGSWADAAVKTYQDAVAAGQDGAVAAQQTILGLRKSFETTDLKLDSSKRDAIIGSAMRDIRSMEVERRAQQTELNKQILEAGRDARAEISQGESTFGESLKSGVQIPHDAIDYLSGVVGAHGTPLQKLEWQRQLTANGYMQQFNSMTVAQMDAQLGVLQSQAATDYTTATVIHDVAAGVANRKQLAIASPQTLYSRVHGEDRPTIDWTKPDPAAIGAAFDYADKAADAYQVAPKYLTPSDKAAVVAISTMGGDTAVKAFESIVQGAGADRAQKFFAETGNADAIGFGYAGSILASGGDPHIARAIARGAEYLHAPGALKFEFKNDERQKIFDRVARPALASATDESVKGLAAAANYAYAGLAQDRGVHTTRDAETAYTDALNGVLGKNGQFGGPVRVNNSTIIAPTWVKASQLPNLINSLSPAQMKLITGGHQAMVNDFWGSLHFADANDLKGAHLVPLDGNGRFLVSSTDPAQGPRYWKTQNHQNVIIDLNAVRPAWKQARPDAVK